MTATHQALSTLDRVDALLQEGKPGEARIALTDLGWLTSEAVKYIRSRANSLGVSA